MERSKKSILILCTILGDGVFAFGFFCLLFGNPSGATLRRLFLFSLLTAVLMLLVGGIVFYLNEKTTRLAAENRAADIRSSLEKEYLSALLSRDENTRKTRAKTRSDLSALERLFAEHRNEEFSAYLSEMETQFTALSSSVRADTGNLLVSAILSDIAARFPAVSLSVNGHLPAFLAVSQADTCVIFSNAFSNAFEAADETETPYVAVEFRISDEAGTVIVTVENPFSHIILSEHRGADEVFRSTKTGDGHGYGFRNLKTAVEKNGGIVRVRCDKQIFTLTFTLPFADDTLERGV